MAGKGDMNFFKFCSPNSNMSKQITNLLRSYVQIKVKCFNKQNGTLICSNETQFNSH